MLTIFSFVELRLDAKIYLHNFELLIYFCYFFVNLVRNVRDSSSVVYHSVQFAMDRLSIFSILLLNYNLS